MLPLLIGAGVGALAGGIKSVIDSGNEKTDRLTKFVRDAYSPWSGMKGQEVQRTNVLGNVMGGAATGLSMGQGVQTASNQQQILDKITKDGSGNLWSGVGQGVGAGIGNGSVYDYKPGMLSGSTYGFKPKTFG